MASALRTKTSKTMLSAALALCLTGWQNTGFAQSRATLAQRQSTLPVDQRQPKEMTPRGFQWRGFFLSPRLKSTLEYNDNIFSTNNNPESDVILRLEPELHIDKNYRSHNFNLDIKSEIRRFRDNENENINDVDIISDNIIQMKRDISIPVKLAYTRKNLHRSTPGNARFTREPITETQYEIQSGLNYSFNRLNLSMQGSYNNTSFEDGTSRTTGNPITFSNNDRESYTAALIANYEILARNPDVPEHVLSARLDYKRTLFDRRSSRDNRQYGMLAGLKTEYKQMIFGRIAAGFFRQDFDQNGVESTDNLDFEADLEFLVTPKTLISFKAARDANQSNEFNQGIINSEYKLSYNYELQHDLYINGLLALETDNITNDTRSDDTYSFGVSLRHLHSRYFTSRVKLRHKTRKSNSASNEFDQNIIMYTFTSRL